MDLGDRFHGFVLVHIPETNRGCGQNGDSDLFRPKSYNIRSPHSI